MKNELPNCPFCDHPRKKGTFICEQCGADLVWLIPWEEGGSALPILEAEKAPRD